MMKRKIYYILHGYGADPEDNWFPWLKKELEDRGHKVVVPRLPNTDNPKLKDWLDSLEKTVEKNGKGIIISHSLGGVLAVRYLLEGGKADKAILVAPPFFRVGYLPKVTAIDKFLDLPDNIDNLNFIKTDFLVFYSQDDPMVPRSHGEEWVKILDAKVVILPKMHFLIREFPEILDYID